MLPNLEKVEGAYAFLLFIHLFVYYSIRHTLPHVQDSSESI